MSGELSGWGAQLCLFGVWTKNTGQNLTRQKLSKNSPNKYSVLIPTALEQKLKFFLSGARTFIFLLCILGMKPNGNKI